MAAMLVSSADDKRFASPAWQAQPPFKMLADAYLATSQALLKSLDASVLAPDEKKRAHFFLKQYLDAVAPSNFLATNPDALKLAIDIKGESIRGGIKNLQEDVDRGRVSITDQ